MDDKFQYTPDNNQPNGDNGYSWGDNNGTDNSTNNGTGNYDYSAPVNNQGYDPNGYNMNAGAPNQQKDDKFNLMSLIFGIVSLVLCNPLGLFSILAVVFAFMGRSRSMTGKFDGKALAGMICGIIGLLAFILGFVLVIFYYIIFFSMI